MVFSCFVCSCARSQLSIWFLVSVHQLSAKWMFQSRLNQKNYRIRGLWHRTLTIKLFKLHFQEEKKKAILLGGNQNQFPSFSQHMHRWVQKQWAAACPFPRLQAWEGDVFSRKANLCTPWWRSKIRSYTKSVLWEEERFILVHRENHYFPAASLITPSFHRVWCLESAEVKMPSSLDETCLLFTITLARLHYERWLQSRLQREAGLCHPYPLPMFSLFAAARPLAR